MTIPHELTQIPQWVLWRSEHNGGPKATKVPYTALGHHRADITDRASFATYNDTLNGHSVGFSGRGFVVTDQDEYTGIDLDDPFAYVLNGVLMQLPDNDPDAQRVMASHMRIVEHLNSYTEWSPSGRGLRIWVKGKLPPEWRNRVGKVEIYSRARFLTCTGSHVQGTPETIEHRQQELEDVARSLGLDKAKGSSYVSQPETRPDVEVFNAAANASTGAKFLALYRGDATGYGSGSEADQALANYLCFFTGNYDQAYRMFLASPYFAGRTKLHSRTEYLVGRVIENGFDQKPPPIDTSALRPPVAETAAPASTEQPQQQETVITPPPGLMGFIADYLYRSAPRPIPEFALAGAIGLMAGVAGRSFNISGQGLNQYVVMIGRTGMGKDSVPNGISKLLAEIAMQNPAARSFQGPRGIASAQGLYKSFSADAARGSLSYVSLIPEFGEFLKGHSDERADSNKIALMAAILEIYGKSGRNNEAGSIVYSDREKNVAAIKSPAFSFIGDTVASSFYEACTARNISKGLIPRLFIMEYAGLRPPLNVGAHHHRADADMLTYFNSFVTTCLAHNQSNTPVDVQTDPEAQALFDAFLAECDHVYNSRPDEAIGSIWSRAHLKALKLAALVAVGCNWHNPMILAENARWAIALARRDVNMLMSKIDAGEIDGTPHEQPRDAAWSSEQRTCAHLFHAHITKPYAQLNVQRRDSISQKAHESGIMKQALFLNDLRKRAPFKNVPGFDRRTREILEVIKSLNGILEARTGDQIRQADVGLFDACGLKSDAGYVVCLDWPSLFSILGITHPS